MNNAIINSYGCRGHGKRDQYFAAMMDRVCPHDRRELTIEWDDDTKQRCVIRWNGFPIAFTDPNDVIIEYGWQDAAVRNRIDEVLAELLAGEKAAGQERYRAFWAGRNTERLGK